MSASSPTPAAQSRRSKSGAWLLALAPLFYAPAVALNAGPINSILAEHGVGQIAFVTLTREQMDWILAAWLPFHASLYVATAVVPVALLLVAVGLHASADRVWRIVALATAGIAIPLVVVYSVLDALALGFTTPTLGEDASYAVANVLGYVVFGLTLAGLGAVAVALIASRRRPVLGWILAVLAAIFLLGTVIAPSYAPPFATALIACPLGIGLLIGPRRQRATAVAVPQVS